MEQPKCARSSCPNTGRVAFRVRPDLLYCQGCFDYLAGKLRRINAQMRKLRTARNLQAERDMLERADNEPARIHAEM